MRKGLIIFLFVVLTIMPTTVYAGNNEFIYYTNSNGVELTKQQYSNLLRGFDVDIINSMTQEMIDLYKNDGELNNYCENEAYILSDETYDVSGNLKSVKETKLTEKQAKEYLKNKKIDVSEDNSANSVTGISLLSLSNWSDTHTTAMKKITMNVTTGASVSYKSVTLTTEWLILPSIRSYDVIDLMPGSTSFTINNTCISGYQKADSTTYSYSYGSSNTKITSTGVGISMNLSNSATSSLVCSITVIFITGADPFYAYGSYQHATSTVTLSESQNYSINSGGYGGVIDFNSSVKSKYDNTSGLSVRWSLSDII
ncbi:MAG: hypothetical protein ACERKV_12635 [Clostridiaceae bacterium]